VLIQAKSPVKLTRPESLVEAQIEDSIELTWVESQVNLDWKTSRFGSKL